MSKISGSHPFHPPAASPRSSPSESAFPAKYQHILAEFGGVIGEWRVLLIIQAALDSQLLFFGAALHDPTEVELDSFFEDFVTRCVVSSSEWEAQ